MKKKIFLIIIALAGVLIGGYYTYLYYQHRSFKGRVCLVALGRLPLQQIALLKRQIEAFYHFEVTVLPTQPLPAQAYYKPRNRYKALGILEYLVGIKPGDQDKIIGLTEKDISVKMKSHDDWGIMGLAWRGGPCCIISSFRLKRDYPSEVKFRERLTKVMLHEVGHTLGLEHCTKALSCFMNDANGSIKTIDREKVELCAACRAKIDYKMVK